MLRIALHGIEDEKSCITNIDPIAYLLTPRNRYSSYSPKDRKEEKMGFTVRHAMELGH